MAENSKIEWCDHTVNLWWGCYEVHAGCDNCYAKTFANRYHGPHVLWQQQGPRMVVKSAFNDLLKYQARAAKENKKYYIFMNSMSDIFEKSMSVVDFNHQPLLDNYDEQVFTEDIRSKFFTYVDDCPNLIFLLLTKRPSNIIKMIPETWIKSPRPNVLFGTSIVNQSTANTLISQLIEVPGLHFLSIEPLVSRVDICTAIRDYQFKKFGSFESTFFDDKIQWVIVGGESGIGARPMNNEWAEFIYTQCATSGVPFFFKQWGEWMPLVPLGHGMKSTDGSNRIWHHEKSTMHKFTKSNNQLFYHSGKKDSGSMLLGKQFKEMPL